MEHSTYKMEVDEEGTNLGPDIILDVAQLEGSGQLLSEMDNDDCGVPLPSKAEPAAGAYSESRRATRCAARRPLGLSAGPVGAV